MADTKLTRESRSRRQRKLDRQREVDLMCEHLECSADDGCLHYDGFSGDSLARY